MLFITEIMKNNYVPFVMLAMSLLGCPVFAQTGSEAATDTTLLGLPGDNLDLFAVLDLFQKSKTIEDFEKTLNEEKTGINNLDLDLNNQVDFIKVVTKQDGDDFTFVLQVDVNEKEIQDVAVILVSKDKNEKVSMQIVGDKDLYGKDYVIEPRAAETPTVTPNPGYTGSEPATAVAAAPATTTVVVVESAPIVQYVYSPVYVPYHPPYYYGFYPPYFVAYTVLAVSVYHHHHYYHHAAYHGGHGNTVVIHNTNNFNNYNNSRNTSNTVNHYNASGNYNGNRTSASPTIGSPASARPSTSPTTSQPKASSTSAKPSTSTRSSSSATRSTDTGSKRAGGRGGRRR